MRPLVRSAIPFQRATPKAPVEWAPRQQAAAEIAPITGLPRWCRTYGFAVEIAASLAVGLVAVFLFASPEQILFGLAGLGIWAAAAFHRGRQITSPLPQQLRLTGQSAVLSIASCALLATVVGVPQPTLAAAVWTILVAASVSGVCRGLRRQLQDPVRVVLVGDRVGIAMAANRWRSSDRVVVVAAVLVEPDDDAAATDVMGIPTISGLAAAPVVVDTYSADLVVLAPGPGLTSREFRRLTWSLERSHVSIGVCGVLDWVRPSRINPGTIHRATVCDVGTPRPSAYVRGLKWAVDRVGAALLLVLVAPLLVAMSVAIRLDSPGKALFTQTRIGLNGRPFRVYKMRTMVADAEAIKADLSDENEYDGLLFKMKHDPRITRVGALLRRTSLDEVPQLINVLRGEMSLVGPRPSLPSEVAVMEPDTQRRLAVRPGITGLWQVSGRSDLGWEEAVALDTYYADNWSLLGDLSIGFRTVKAVLTAKGAY